MILGVHGVAEEDEVSPVGAKLGQVCPSSRGASLVTATGVPPSAAIRRESASCSRR
jgi:hypothetical protein